MSTGTYSICLLRYLWNHFFYLLGVLLVLISYFDAVFMLMRYFFPSNHVCVRAPLRKVGCVYNFRLHRAILTRNFSGGRWGLWGIIFVKCISCQISLHRCFRFNLVRGSYNDILRLIIRIDIVIIKHIGDVLLRSSFLLLHLGNSINIIIVNCLWHELILLSNSMASMRRHN